MDFFASAEANTLMKAGLSPGSQISVFGGAVRVIRAIRAVKEVRVDREVRDDFGL